MRSWEYFLKTASPLPVSPGGGGVRYSRSNFKNLLIPFIQQMHEWDFSFDNYLNNKLDHKIYLL